MSKIEVDAIDKQSGSTLTLGGSGTAVTLACGATQTGFGRTGTVNWVTTKKTTAFTAAVGSGYFCNTSGGAFTVNLPAGAAGNVIAVKDYLNSFDSSYGVTASGERTIRTFETDNSNASYRPYLEVTTDTVAVTYNSTFFGSNF